MKCCDMNAGLLRETLVIEEKIRTTDEIGGSVNTWRIRYTVRAHVKGVGGTERWNYGDNTFMRPATENRYLAVIRFIGDEFGSAAITAENRVKLRGRIYAIESAMDMEYKQKWLELMLAESKPS